MFRRATPAPLGRKTLAPSSPFARVAPPPTHVPAGTTPRFRPSLRGGPAASSGSALGPVPVVDSQHDLDAMAIESVFDELVRLDVDPWVAQELSNIDPRGTYVVIATVRGGSGRSGQAGAPDKAKAYEDEHRIVLIGRGARLWGSFLHLADPDGGGSELLDVEVLEAPPGEKDEAFPLWSGQTVTVSSGRVVEGSGQRALWEAYRDHKRGGEGGRKKKSGGGMNAEERRKHKHAERERKRRARATGGRVRALQTSDPVAAARLKKRSEKARASKAKRNKPGKGRTR